MMIITKTEKEEEEDQKRLSRPSCLIFLGESTLSSGKKVLKKKKTKKKIIFFFSVCFLAWTALFLVVAGFACSTHPQNKKERARERTTVKHFCVIYIYIRRYSAKQ